MSLGPVAAVVPLHRPGPAVVALVEALSVQVGGRVVVVDDTGPTTAYDGVLEAVRATGAILVRHPVNQGIAAALTLGVARARERWPQVRSVLTVDQDSRLVPDHVARLLDAADRAAAVGLPVGLVGPAGVEGLPTRVAGPAGPGPRGAVLLGREPLQSGLLVPLEVWDQVGGLDAGLVIDGVDSDLWLKVLDAGRVLVVAEGLVVGHHLGTAREVRVAGRRVVVPVSAPFRAYYLVRNRLRLAARHGRRHPRWAAAQLLGLVRHLAAVTLADPPGRRERASAARAGLVDALRRRDGVRRGP